MVLSKPVGATAYGITILALENEDTRMHSVEYGLVHEYIGIKHLPIAYLGTFFYVVTAYQKVRRYIPQSFGTLYLECDAKPRVGKSVTPLQRKKARRW